jgi:hypothetical protein
MESMEVGRRHAGAQGRLDLAAQDRVRLEGEALLFAEAGRA